MKRSCPACPDGNVWDSNGPTGKACPVCKGNAFLGEDHEDDNEWLEDIPEEPERTVFEEME